MRDHLRDYATNAFIAYARAGKPTYTDLRDRLLKKAASKSSDGIAVQSAPGKPTEAAVMAAQAELDKAAGILGDLLAVDRTIEQIKMRPDGNEIMYCLNTVYFFAAHRPLQRGEITERATYAASEMPADIRTVFRKLAIARKIFAIERGLNVVSNGTILSDIISTVITEQ